MSTLEQRTGRTGDCGPERLEAELLRRDAILEAVRHAAQRFLESHSSWRVHIHDVLARLGNAAAVSRVYIFENFRGADGALWTAQSHEWTAPGVAGQRMDGAVPLSAEQAEFRDLSVRLGAGDALAGNVTDLPDGERAFALARGVRSLVLVPIFVDQRWWGLVGFDECTRDRTWSTTEIEALRAAASTLSAAVRRQRAEDESREQQARYRQIFEATGDGLVITDLDGNLVRANPAFYRMHGYRPDELRDKPASTWTHPSHREARDRYTADVMAGGQPRMESVAVRKDGSTFPIQIHGSAFNFQGRPHILGVVRDDTERAQAFELLEKRVSSLSTIAASLTLNQALPDILDVILRQVVAATPAIAASAYLIDPEDDALRVYAELGLPAGYVRTLEKCWREDGGLTHRTKYFADEPMIVRNAPLHVYATPGLEPMRELVAGAAWDTVAIVPVQSQGHHMGTVNAYYPAGAEPSPDDLTFLRAAADQAAVAARNARLLVEAQGRAGMEERQRLARELHDSVSQALYGIALGARTARTLSEQRPDQLTEPLDYVLSLAEVAMAEMRSLIFELRPESLATEGLIAALDKRAEVLRARHQLVVRADLGGEPDIPLRLKETLYRIAQEALHNAVKHAQAGQVSLRLTLADGKVELEIVDDGVGFESSSPRPGHIGMQSMAERAATHGGTVDVHSQIGQGTTVRAVLPTNR